MCDPEVYIVKVSTSETRTSSETPIHSDEMALQKATRRTDKKLSWYYAPGFLLFWLVLFFAVVLPVFLHLPEGLTVRDEAAQPAAFIAERSERILVDFDAIGPKDLGSYANENRTVQLLLDEVEKVRRVMRADLYDLEVDLQVVSGNFLHFSMVNMYRGVQNVAVRLSAKKNTSQSYLLINSHFDSKPGSPAAGDDGTMVAVMLEVLRVLATSRQKFTHPIVFLFNGAEENGLQGAHGFITQHKWAKNCKAVINLDSAGSGHKELLFQAAPNHPWIMEYYRKYCRHPYATTVADELFQADFIPSDTDFRIWKNYGKLPGLDLAHTYNGYVYHTKFDKANIIPRGTLQSTGDNILSLARALADAPELENSGKHTGGLVVFYDFLGLFFIFYTETQSQILNACVSAAALTIVGISIWRMAACSDKSLVKVSCVFAVVSILHVIGFILSFVLPLAVAVLFDSGNRSMTWFTHKWLVLGLYASPSAFGLAAPTLLLMSLSRYDNLSQSFKLQLVLHSHCVILAVACVVGTCLGVRSSYLLFISISFYLLSLLFNLATNLYKGYYWVIPLIVGQILPFLYFSYLIHSFLCAIIPMTERDESESNQEVKIATITTLGTLLAMGFLIPLLNIFRKSMTILLSLLVITFIFSMIAMSPVGFPYRPETNVGRLQAFHVHQVFYEYDKSVSCNESGYYFEYTNRYKLNSFKTDANQTATLNISDNRNKDMKCGQPILYRRSSRIRFHNEWLPTSYSAAQPSAPKLTLLERITNPTRKSAHFEFELAAESFMGLYFETLEGVTFTDWTFVKDKMQNPEQHEPSYNVHITAGKERAPLKFFIDLRKNDSNLEVPLFKLSIYTYFTNTERRMHEQDECEQFSNNFPDYLYVTCWPTSYERYIF